MIKEHDPVVVTADLPQHDLKAGDVGVVVHIYADGEAYELEIFSADGRTQDVVTVDASQVRAVRRDDVPQVR